MTIFLLVSTHMGNEYSVSVVDAFATEQLAIDFVNSQHPECDVSVADYAREHCFIRKVVTVTSYPGWKDREYQVLEMEVQGAIVSRSIPIPDRIQANIEQALKRAAEKAIRAEMS